MGDLVSEIFSGFTTTITGLAGGIKTAFSTLLYADAYGIFYGDNFEKNKIKKIGCLLFF